ncbi:MAG: putative integral membrane protein [Paracoccaceae bacterium]|jgi:putative membrane protein
MMRILKLLVLAVVAVAAVILAVANRDMTTLNLLPVSIDLGFPTSATLPLFTVILASVFVGILIGLVLEALRETEHRRNERDLTRKTAVLNREVHRLAKKAGEEDDDILGIRRV